MKEKNDYLKLLTSVVSTAGENIKKINNPEGYVSYVTSFGFVQGKIFEPQNLESSSEEDLVSSLQNVLEEKGQIDLISITYSLYKSQNNESQRSYAIHLEDVSIKPFNSNNIINLNIFVLFLDNVTGFIPGKMI